MNQKLKIILVIIFSFVVIGCGGGSGDGGGDGGSTNVRPSFDLESDCEAAARVVPFPDLGSTDPDVHLQLAALVGTWVCSGTAVGFQNTRRTLTLNSNGTFRDTFQSGLSYPDDMREQWNQCRLGTAPPVIAGHWTIVAISDERLELCFRADVMPFRSFCGPAPHGTEYEIWGGTDDQSSISESGQMVIPAGEVEVWEGGSTFANSYFYPFTETCVKR